MAWPPPAQPINRTNATPQLNTHAADHNALGLAVNDIVAHIQANDASITSAFTQLRTQSFDFKSTAGPGSATYFAGGATWTSSGMNVQFTMPGWANKIMVLWALSGHSGDYVANATFILNLSMTPSGALTPSTVIASSGIGWRLQGSSVGAGLFAATQGTVVRFDIGGSLLSGSGAALRVDGGAQLAVAAFFQSAT
jgi:hypothetical protein